MSPETDKLALEHLRVIRKDIGDLKGTQLTVLHELHVIRDGLDDRIKRIDRRMESLEGRMTSLEQVLTRSTPLAPQIR